jgi:isopentenyl diphosphate isomerase/L-lactate dehydrogenase-like FMN-dependent dehydrogenase
MKRTGDIAKSFVAGADFVMLGGMFAFHNECEEDIIDGKILSFSIRDMIVYQIV